MIIQSWKQNNKYTFLSMNLLCKEYKFYSDIRKCRLGYVRLGLIYLSSLTVYYLKYNLSGSINHHWKLMGKIKQNLQVKIYFKFTFKINLTSILVFNAFNRYQLNRLLITIIDFYFPPFYSSLLTTAGGNFT